MDSLTCDNCGGVIGRLEEPVDFQGHAVCSDCHQKLIQHAASGDYPDPQLWGVADESGFGLPKPHRRAGSRRSAVTAVGRVPRVQTIEQTSKLWKGLMLLGLTMVPAGCYMAGYAAEHFPTGEQQVVSFVGAWLMFGGFVLFVFAKIAAWWHHG